MSLIRSGCLILTSLVAMFAATPAALAELQHHRIDLRFGDDEVALAFALVLPDDFDPARTYPAVLAIPPGAGHEQMVDRGMAFWEQRARDEGWIVVSPAVIGQTRWQDGGHVAIPPLLDWVRENFNIEDDAFHIVGVSMGGEGAWTIAIEYPREFLSLTTLPGLPRARDRVRLSRVRSLPIMTYVGAKDSKFYDDVRALTSLLSKQGIEARLQVIRDAGHVLKSLEGGERLFAYLDKQRRTRSRFTDQEAEVSAALTDFHDAAAVADADRYFGRFAPRAVFFGTAPEERWSLGELREYATPHFQGESAWVYTCTKRSVFIAPGGDFAWFDERLSNDKYGECRGTGVLRKIGDRWRIAQYNLSIPIPNDIAPSVVDLIGATDTIVVDP